jgi:cis-L-3-hydroxyproline dehydratase
VRITRITAYCQNQPFRDGAYTCSGGRSALGFDSTIVRIDTDAGLAGWGEMAPLGAFYDPSFAAGARAALAALAPALIGADPLQTVTLNRCMAHVLKGHPTPSPRSTWRVGTWSARTRNSRWRRCWAGASARPFPLPLGPASGAIRMADQARAYVAAGYKRIQVKVGLDPDEDVARIEAVRDALPRDVVLFADANSGWSTHQARRFLRATRSLDYYLEQPCGSYEENLAVRGDCDRPLVLDESIDSLAVLMRACADRLADGITIKLARVGGITKARLIRDTAVEMGLAVTVEDTGGAEIDTAAMAHMSLSTPESARLHTVDFHNWVRSATRPEFRPVRMARWRRRLHQA